ncbi:hypothetical protein [Perlucidibaca aquatica]|uniref:hypothetical protein n=1 Tax=Perlucidibaca aquatica TaxID=1852776 RepID=UPI0012FDF59F|nr:hypothetical protein [Perlucidibaca aquatica]
MKTLLSDQLTPPGGWRTPGRVRLKPLTVETSTRAQRLLMHTICIDPLISAQLSR